MTRYCFIFITALFVFGILQGFTNDPTISLTANTVQMEKATSYDINIMGKRPGLTYHWTTSDNTVVTVNSKNGIINAVNAGEALINCFITGINGENLQLTCKVTVGAEPSGPRLKRTQINLMRGEQFDINIAGKIPKSKYKWSSSNKAVIGVNVFNGLVMAIGDGVARVTCTITAPEQHIIILTATVNVKEQSNILWEENFDSSTLDRDKWDYEYGYVRNSELQEYTDSTENVYLRDGHLVLKAIKDGRGSWTSASIHTNNKLEVGNARVEARIRLPYESGAFPAFWMLGADYEVDYSRQRGRGDTWLEAREIDIMEAFGKVTRVQGGVFIKAHPGATALSQYAGKSEEIDITEFHIYAVEKSEETIKFYCDDKLYFTHEITDEGMKEPFYLLLNLAVGAAGGIPDSSVTEMEVMVDYVRVTALDGRPITEVESITLDREEYIGRAGDVKKLNVTLLPSGAQDRTVTWSSSDPGVALVYGGYVRLLKTGTSIISATAPNGVTTVCKVICY